MSELGDYKFLIWLIKNCAIIGWKIWNFITEVFYISSLSHVLMNPESTNHEFPPKILMFVLICSKCTFISVSNIQKKCRYNFFSSKKVIAHCMYVPAF